MKNTTDYSDEFSTLKELHEDNTGKKFSDEEFNEIFSLAEQTNKDLAKHADRFQSDMMGLLMTLDEATHKWEEEKLIKSVKGNVKEELKGMVSELAKVIDYYANDKNANWGTVGTLANIHESLGKQLYRNYEKHQGYSKTLEEGMKRHSEASKNLLLQAEEEIQNLDVKKHLPDLARWKNFFEDLLSGFQGLLHKKEETPTEKKETAPVKKQSLREEAIGIAIKLGDKELAKYLEKAPMKSIQRRIKALREEAEKPAKAKKRRQ